EVQGKGRQGRQGQGQGQGLAGPVSPSLPLSFPSFLPSLSDGFSPRSGAVSASGRGVRRWGEDSPGRSIGRGRTAVFLVDCGRRRGHPSERRLTEMWPRSCVL